MSSFEDSHSAITGVPKSSLGDAVRNIYQRALPALTNSDLSPRGWCVEPNGRESATRLV